MINRKGPRGIPGIFCCMESAKMDRKFADIMLESVVEKENGVENQVCAMLFCMIPYQIWDELYIGGRFLEKGAVGHGDIF